MQSHNFNFISYFSPFRLKCHVCLFDSQKYMYVIDQQEHQHLREFSHLKALLILFSSETSTYDLYKLDAQHVCSV